jgi:hypothetical protein
VRILPSKTGQFAQRPHFEAGEIDKMCALELHKLGLFPSSPGEVRIERFLERRFGISVEYDDLPPAVLGYTRFGVDRVEAIVISRQLGDEDSSVAERRIRTTMAHEAGHGLMHLHFINLSGASCPLFGEQPTDRRVLCRDEQSSGASGTYSGQWWEYQANQAIGGLLMPRSLVKKLVDPYLMDGGKLIAKPVLDPSQRTVAISAVADTFNVNPAAARLRLAVMFPEDPSGQLSL